MVRDYYEKVLLFYANISILWIRFDSVFDIVANSIYKQRNKIYQTGTRQSI